MLFLENTLDDLENIFKFYDAAIEFQKTVFHKQWQNFDRAMIETEIREHRHWKIVVENQVAGVFSITFNDTLIWGDDAEPSIYLHRIVTNPAFRGKGFVKNIRLWANDYGKSLGKKFVRMDTWGENEKLIAYYVSCGFNFMGFKQMTEIEGLPKHYSTAFLSLFEIEIV